MAQELPSSKNGSLYTLDVYDVEIKNKERVQTEVNGLIWTNMLPNVCSLDPTPTATDVHVM